MRCTRAAVQALLEAADGALAQAGIDGERLDAEVIALAGRLAEFDLGTLISGARYRWLALFPLIAAQLQSGNPAAAIAAARQIVDPAQQLLPDELMAALDAALAAWDGGEATAAEERLASALRLAHELHFF